MRKENKQTGLETMAIRISDNNDGSRYIALVREGTQTQRSESDQVINYNRCDADSYAISKSEESKQKAFLLIPSCRYPRPSFLAGYVFARCRRSYFFDS